MFGKRNQDRKHRFAEEGAGDSPDVEARPEAADPELAAALVQLGLNRHAPLVEKPDTEASEPAAPDDSIESRESLEQDVPDEANVPSQPAHSAVPTAAMLAEPEPEPEFGSQSKAADLEPTSVGEVATYAALRRERAKVVEQEAALRQAQDEASALKSELKNLRAAAKATEGVDVQAATTRANELEQSLLESEGRVEELTAAIETLQSTDADAQLKAAQERASELERSQAESQRRVEELTAEVEALRSASGDIDVSELRSAAERAAAERADAAERSVQDLQSKVSALTADLERSRAEAAAAGVALDRIKREAKDEGGALAEAEERAERLAAEVEKLRAELAMGPAQVERLRRDGDREKTLRAAMEQAQASHAQAEAVLADNRRLASDLAANLQSQEGLIFALAGLQAEVTEQRAWFEEQIAHGGEAEGQQTGVIDALQAAIQDRDVELQVLRQQLLEVEAKRAEEAAAFVAALERP